MFKKALVHVLCTFSLLYFLFSIGGCVKITTRPIELIGVKREFNSSYLRIPPSLKGECEDEIVRIVFSLDRSDISTIEIENIKNKSNFHLKFLWNKARIKYNNMFRNVNFSETPLLRPFTASSTPVKPGETINWDELPNLVIKLNEDDHFLKKLRDAPPVDFQLILPVKTNGRIYQYSFTFRAKGLSSHWRLI
jgi:hypothetical protein